MFEINSKKINLGKQNICKTKNISLNKNLDCFIVINAKDEKFVDLTIRNILDFIIDKISIENTYKEFSIALENINSFIKTWKSSNNNNTNIDIFIGILNKNELIFSSIGECCCYLIKEDNDLIELINKNDNKKQFSFILNGELKENEIIFVSNNILLDYLSNSDLIDGLNKNRELNYFNDNIENILQKEIVEDNFAILTIKYNPIIYSDEIIEYKKSNYFTKIKLCLKKLKEHKISNNLNNMIKDNKNKIKQTYNKSPKNIKNIIIIIGIIISLILMYKILFNVINISTKNDKKENLKIELQQAKENIIIASENIINPDIFDNNINQAEEKIKNIKQENLFLDDINKLNEDINVLKKQFNKIEIFTNNEENAIYNGDLKNSIKLIKVNQKPYIITEKGIIGPILPNTKENTYIFNLLETNEIFVDASSIGTDIILLTNQSKVVRFTSNGYFEYSNVINQNTWEKTKEIKSYNSNIYLLGKENNQIFKHTKTGNNFTQAEGYLKDDDLTQIGEILSIAIDGGIYILKKDLSIIKFFSIPYTIEKIILNKLPQNYNLLEEDNNKINLKTRYDLNYIYLLMNNKIWVLKPNSNNYNDTKSLTYIGQIESNGENIKDFYVNYDGEILILNEKGIYRLSFEISDEKIIIR